MFGNKKTTSASNDNDIQLTTRSMKSDLEGGSSNNIINEEPLKTEGKTPNPINPIKKPELKPQLNPIKSQDPVKSMDFPQKPEAPKGPINPIKTPEIKSEMQKAGNFELPTDIPTSNKIQKNFSANNSIKKNDQEETHADTFFPVSDKKENFPKNPIKPLKKESLETPKQLKEELVFPAAELKVEKPTKEKSLVKESTKTNYDEFFKDKIKPIPEPKPEIIEEKKHNSSSMIIIIILIIVLIVAIISGAYYYFFVIKKPIEPISPPVTEQTFPVEPIEPLVEETLPEALIKAGSIIPTTDQDIRTILFDSQNPSNLSSGFYSIKNNEGESILIKDISALLNVQLPATIDITSREAWIYYDNSKSTSGISLVIKIDPKNNTLIKESVSESEELIFNMLAGLYTSPVNQYITGETIIFKDSRNNPGFRYYNLETAPTPTSLDWGILSDDRLLIFATSKEMAIAISDQLSNEQFLEKESSLDLIPIVEKESSLDNGTEMTNDNTENELDTTTKIEPYITKDTNTSL